MTPVDYFKLQAKNLLKDYKTQYVYRVDKDGLKHYTYRPKYFDVDLIVLDFDLREDEPFSLMKAQHLIARMLGFNKWPELINASATGLELAKLRFDNQDKISLEEWDIHIAELEQEYESLDDEAKLHFFKHGLSVAEGPSFIERDYRLNGKTYGEVSYTKPVQSQKSAPDVQITALPLSKEDRAEFIEAANSVFENIFERIEPNNPEETRKLWDAGDYVDNFLLREDMLPISKDYALSLIDAFLVHHVIGLATQADKKAARS